MANLSGPRDKLIRFLLVLPFLPGTLAFGQNRIRVTGGGKSLGEITINESESDNILNSPYAAGDNEDEKVLWDIDDMLDSVTENDTKIKRKDRTAIQNLPVLALSTLPQDKLGAILPELNAIITSKPDFNLLNNLWDSLQFIARLIGFSSFESSMIDTVMCLVALAAGIFWAVMFVLMYEAIFSGSETFRRNMKKTPHQSLFNQETLNSFILKGIEAVQKI